MKQTKEYQIIAEKYIQILNEQNIWHKTVDEITDDQYIKLVTIETPSDITSFKLLDAWEDDHTTCVGIEINGIKFGVWWLYNTDQENEPRYPNILQSKNLTPELQSVAFKILQHWLNTAEDNGPRDPKLIPTLRPTLKKQRQVKDIISKNNQSGWEM